MKVQIISKEMVKPSSPTPHHLQTYKLSLLDQITLQTFYPAVLYFLPEPDSNSSRKIHILKESLSSNLTRFYPFAGIINDDLSVKCNDEGIPFFVAKVNCNLRDFLTQPDLMMIMKFVPIDCTSRIPNPGDHVSMIQVNCFECGGLAISMVVAHAVADGTTLATFLKGWAAAACSSTGTEEICPKFIGQNLFPSIDAMESESKLYSYYYTNFARLGKFVTRRYLFDASVIAKLKERATSSVTAKPTSVEVVLAFLWKCYIKSFTDKSNLEGPPFLLAHQVNLRRRADPALPDESFGNFLWIAATKCINPADTNFRDLLSEVNRAIRKIDDKFVKSLQNNGYFEISEETRSKWFLKGANPLPFSSWCKFGFYDIDFGWGKPIWLSGYVCGDSKSICSSSVVLLMDTRSGDGIEAWVILDEKHVLAFEENDDLQNYVLINPSPLQIGKRIL